MRKTKPEIRSAKTVKWYGLAETDLFSLQEGKRVRFDGHDIMLFNLGDGVFKAIENKCPQKGERFNATMMAGGFVWCSAHSLKINLHTGWSEETDGKVKIYPVRVWNDIVYVAFDEAAYFEKTETVFFSQGGGV